MPTFFLGTAPDTWRSGAQDLNETADGHGVVHVLRAVEHLLQLRGIASSLLLSSLSPRSSLK